jgi:DtxR family manganese transport transcriptional regulator
METASDYVELIAALIEETGEARKVDMAKHLQVSHVSVTKAIQRLARDGFVEAKPYRSVFLTAKGERLALEAKRKHELLLGLLKKLGVTDATAEVDAEGMEHHASEETLDAIARFLRKR